MLSARILAGRSYAAFHVVKRHSLRTPRFLSTVSMPSPPTSNHAHKPLPGAKGSIVYTETDEAPSLATYSLLPVIAKVRLCLSRVNWSDNRILQMTVPLMKIASNAPHFVTAPSFSSED